VHYLHRCYVSQAQADERARRLKDELERKRQEAYENDSKVTTQSIGVRLLRRHSIKTSVANLM
jgi:hypothetical protein